jgi:hypothetical protein
MSQYSSHYRSSSSFEPSTWIWWIVLAVFIYYAWRRLSANGRFKRNSGHLFDFVSVIFHSLLKCTYLPLPNLDRSIINPSVSILYNTNA